MKLKEAKNVFARVATRKTTARDRLKIKITDKLLGVKKKQNGTLEFFTPKDKITVDVDRDETTIQKRSDACEE